MDEEFFERLSWVLSYFDDKKEKDDSFEVSCIIEEDCSGNLCPASIDPSYIIGYGRNSNEAHENFKKRFHAFAMYIAKMDEDIQMNKTSS